MIKSMTGYASLTREDEHATISVTVRSVNHRFLDVQLRMPPALAAVEARLRALVQQRVARGRTEVSFAIQFRSMTALDVEVNDAVLDAVVAALARARDRGVIQGNLTPGDLLRFPQAVTVRERAEPIPADGAAAAQAEAALGAALEELDTMRLREGEHLRADLDARRALLSDLFTRAARAAEEGLEGVRSRLAERIRELRAEALADEAAVAQEIVRYAARSDITEETVRFRAHLEHWQALSDSPEPCGRKLDFLLQEMNREVNTLGAKAEGPGVPELVVALKAELEKMREQVQNVE
jgi:uncharacterized protein (TIGR00255 family)